MNNTSNTCMTKDVPVCNDSNINKNAPKSMFSTSKIVPNFSIKQTSSGSETDVSTSTENLSPEEHYVLKTTIRQEPQGEETYLINDGLSLNNTLIIHENNSLNNSMYSYMSPLFYGKRNVFNESVMNEKPIKNEKFFYHNHSISEQTDVGKPSPNNEKIGVLNLNNNMVSFVDNDNPYSNLNLIKFCNVSEQKPMSNSQLFIKNDSVIKLQSTPEPNSKNVTSNSSVNLQQPMLNNYLNSLKKKDSLMIKNFNESINFPPPPEYEKQWNVFPLNSNSKSYERLAISRSHPDLSKFGDDEQNNNNNNGNNSLIVKHASNCGYNRNTLRNNTLEMLLTENSALRNELELYFKKVHKLQKFEVEIQKVHQSHEELMRSSEKKEKLERAIRYKLEIEVRRLQEENRCLKDQIDTNITKRTNYENVDSLELKKEINKRDVLISRLLTQNKEFTAEKERQEIELQAQRLTLQEQRNHIEILDTALMNAQNNIITLETELRKKQVYEERTLFLEKALSNLQLANERRLQTEKRVRTLLENEIEELKKVNNSVDSKNSDSFKQNDKDVNSIKKLLREYEEKIISLEAEVSKWEQKYLEESTMRSIEVSATAAPKDAKIAALERTSQESEKIIAEARNENLKQMDEIHVTNKKVAELESKLKDMESKLAERDAMIKVLQKHSEDRNAVLQKTMLVRRFPNRHTRSASTMGLVVSSTSSTNQISSPNTNDVGSISNDFSKLLVTNSPTIIPNNSLCLNHDCQDSSTNIDEQLKEIDSQLSNKDSIIKALRSEKERYPNHYNNWRL